MSETTTTTNEHPFESAGLGLAPFRFESMEHRTFRAVAGAPTQVGSSCDYCGTGICYLFWIVSADGRRFKVGSDCVAKTDPAIHAEIKAAQRAERNAQRDRDLAEEEARGRSSREARAEAFMSKVAGLKAAFAAGALPGADPKASAILADMHCRLIQFGTLTEKQISFALRLGDEILNPKPAEVHVPAPEGRVTFRGTVATVKEVADAWSRNPDATTFKMIVRVEAEGGCWLCWMSVPADTTAQKGDEFTITATLTRGRDAHFAFGKRPVIWTAQGIALEAAKAAKKAAREAKKAAKAAEVK